MNIEKAIKTIENLSEYGLCCEITEEYQEAMNIVLSELEKKDKIIDLMARIMQQILVSTEFIKKQWWKRICKCRKGADLVNCSDKLCEDCVKQYFTKKVDE